MHSVHDKTLPLSVQTCGESSEINIEPFLEFHFAGLDHLLYSGRGAGGVAEEAAELHVACFMDLISFLASRPEVLRVSPRHSQRLFNAAARAIIQSATVTSSPLTDAGLDGTGEVIQVGKALALRLFLFCFLIGGSFDHLA